VTAPTPRQRWRDAIRDSDDPAIDAYTRAVAFALDRHMSPDGQTFTGVRRLGQLAGIDKGTAADRVGRLVELGWLERSTAGRGHKTRYQVSGPTGHLGTLEVSGPSDEVSGPSPQSVRPHRTDPVITPLDPERKTHTHTGREPRTEPRAEGKGWDIDRVVEATSDRLDHRDRELDEDTDPLGLEGYYLTEAFENMLIELGYLNEDGTVRANVPKSLRYEIKTKCDAVNGWLDGNEDPPPVVSTGLRNRGSAIREAKAEAEREAAKANAPRCPACGRQEFHGARDHRWDAPGILTTLNGADPLPKPPVLESAADVWRDRYQPKK
jgi:hypothetical protein